MSIVLDTQNLKKFIKQKEYEAYFSKVEKAHRLLHAQKGKGSEFTGWLDLPSRINQNFIKEVKDLALAVQNNSDCLLSIGIGGSYLGIRATINFLNNETKLPVHYAGHNMSSDQLYLLLGTLKDKRLTTIVISKSGTTTEPALAFRIVKKMMQQKYSSQELKKRIICVTDEKKGALKKIADQNGFKTFFIPDDVGGRFSVLTPVGLVPLSLAGVDIQKLIEGAQKAQKEYGQNDVSQNACYQYALNRHLLYKKGYIIEVLSSFYPNTQYLMEWWKQLFGESEGKDKKGIFPASLVLSTDLHSMGQLLQDGPRNLFETFLAINKTKYSLLIPEEKDDLDNFNYVAGKDLEFVNKQAFKATAMAHYEGGVPNMTIAIDKANAFELGQLYYFFEKAVAVSGYLLGVNPFDQPGVEAYKKKMFELLGKK